MKIFATLVSLGIIAFVLFQFLENTSFKMRSIPTPSIQKIQISASFYPLYFFANRIGGDKVHVTNITPDGLEPHDYEPTIQDLINISKSKLVILNGILEPWGQKLNNDLKNKNIQVIVVGENLFSLETTNHNNKQFPDPHVWLDPTLSEIQVKRILQGLIRVDPANSQYYQENAKTLIDDLDDLNTAFQRELRSCKQKTIITSHASFGYVAKAYHLIQIPIAGLSPDSEPSPKQLAEITAFAKQNKIRYIFFESLLSPKLAKTIAEDVGAQTLILNPLEGRTKDEVRDGKDYLSIQRENVENLKTALECQ